MHGTNMKISCSNTSIFLVTSFKVPLETQRAVHRLTYPVITFRTQIRQDNQQHILYD
jgi:hypothetical protein